MYSKNDKYRNPPAPPGYINPGGEPKFVNKKGTEIDGICYKFLGFIIDSGILEEADATIYEKFVIHTSDEDEVVEISQEVSNAVELECIEIDDDDDDDIVLLSSKKDDLSVAVKEEKLHASAAKKSSKSSSTHEKMTVRKEVCNDACNSEKESKTEDYRGSDHSSHSRKISNDEISHDKKNRKKNKIRVKRDGSYSDGGRGSDRSSHSKNISNNEISHSKNKNKIRKQRDTSNSNSDDDRHSGKSCYSKKTSDENSYKKDKKKTREKRRNDNYSDDDSYSRKGRQKIKDGNVNDSSTISHKTQQRKDHSYNSDESDHSRRRLKRQHSHSPNSEEYMSDECGRNIKQEYLDQHLFGSYHCDDCNITMNSLSTYESHINGKRHNKALKLKNVVETVAKSFIPTQIAQNRYPAPAPGIYRVKVRGLATIQNFIEDNIKVPCLGLENVIEIQGLVETTYYCSLCDSPCAISSITSHLQGFKHHMNLLKLFNPVLYDRLSYHPKYKSEGAVLEELRSIQKKKGMGIMSVEKDYEAEDSSLPSEKSAIRSSRDNPSTSHQNPANFPEYYLSTTIPDKSKSGYYCNICDSHSNSLQMWQSHVGGKRHLANVKKGPGSAPSKSKTIPMPHCSAQLLDALKDVYEPVIGLDQIREIQNNETGGITYICFLCGGCLTTVDIIDHVVSKKHREKYLENINNPDLATFKSLHIQDSSAAGVIADIASKVESEMGRGCPEVHFMKSTILKG